MKLKTLFFAVASILVSFSATAQVVVNNMPEGTAKETVFKAYDNVEVILSDGCGWNKSSGFWKAERPIHSVA